MDEYYFRLIRHWLGFPAIILAGSLFSGIVLAPLGYSVPVWDWAALGMGYFMSLIFYRCPRCGKQIDSPGALDPRNARGFGYYPEATCPRCLRTRKGVKKFQYLFHREPWDGVRHDEP